jgi:hypothetical protein
MAIPADSPGGASSASQFAALLAQKPGSSYQAFDPAQWRLARFSAPGPASGTASVTNTYPATYEATYGTTVDVPSDTEAFWETVAMTRSAYLDGDVEISGNLQVDGTSNIPGTTDWTVVEPSGDTTGATDTASIQAAINAAPGGGTVYLETGIFYTNAPIVFGAKVVLQGSDSSFNWGSYNGGYGNSATAPTGFQSTPPTPPSGAVIRPVAGWAQGAAVAAAVLLFTAPTHYITEGPVLRNICVDGVSLVATADGIQGYGAVADVMMTNVYVMRCTGWGINTAADPSAPAGYSINTPGTWKVHHSEVWKCAAGGINLNFVSDSDWIDVLVEGCNGNGWSITSCDNSHWIGCRAEWSNGHGFHLTGTWLSAAGYGVLQCVFSGCTTDANFEHGFFIDASTGTAVVVLAGCSFHRDGNNATPASWAGLAISQAAAGNLHFQVIVRGLVTSATTGQAGVGPAYGLSLAGTGVWLDIDGARLIGNTGAVLLSGTPARLQVGPGMSYATGDSSGPAVATPANWKSGTATLAAGTVTVANTCVTAASRIWLSVLTPGGTPGAPYVSAVTAGTSFTIKSTAGASDTSVIAYRMDEPG